MDKNQVLEFLDRAGQIESVKIGLELFCREGPSIVETLHNRHKKNIFLDLKLHDIPNTVSGAVKSLAGLPIAFLTVHLTGGREMLDKSLEAARKFLPGAKLLGVSHLTCLDQKDFVELHNIKNEQVPNSFKRLFKLALDVGLPGIVCSAKELPLLSKRESGRLIKVCPGIRFKDETNHDQKRVLSPGEALENGADFLVMGRSLTQSKNLDSRLNELSVLD